MRFLADFLKQTLVGGLLFLVPVAVVVIILEKVVSTLRPPAEEIVERVVGPGILGPFGLVLVLCLALLVLSFVAGLLASTIVGRKAVDSLEAMVLNRVPGYVMVKGMAADAAGNLSRIETSGGIRVVYVKDGDGWKIGFVTDRIDENRYAVFLPDAPTPSSGELVFLSADQFVESGLNIKDAIQCLARLGVRNGQRPIRGNPSDNAHPL